MDRHTYFVDVLLPLHLPAYYTYRVPFDYNDTIAVGQRVVVQFGKRRIYSALVRRVHEDVPAYTTKYILTILDLQPVVNELQFHLWEWMADYYMCYPGDVMAAAFPSAYKLTSESSITIHPDFDGAYSDLDPNELKIVEALLHTAVLPIEKVTDIVGFQKIMPLIQTMISKQIIMMDEELKQRFAPKVATHLVLNPRYADSAELRALFERLEARANLHKQLSVLMLFMQMSQFGKTAVKKIDLLAHKELSQSAIATLIKNEVFLQEEHIESRLQDFDAQTSVDTIELSPQQQQSFDTITSPEQPPVVLLHGVTSSGKTEVYIKLIDQALRRNQQVLFLLPEIALTAQIINRLRRYFGRQVGVYHSRFNPNERVEVWNKTLDPSPNGYRVLIGARSALFLPFHNLGLIIVDEEHDSSYKQYDPAPRYQCRDAAIYLAHLWKARTVLGSATPSIESFQNAKKGKYGYAQMTQRYGGVMLPEVVCVDMKDALRHGAVKARYFSDYLIEQIRRALAAGQQAILFQNRRGFSLRLECEDCGWTPTCQHCDVSLVYHKSTNSLRCHYCGYSIPVPSECPVCHTSHIKTKGFGTEHIEEDLQILFPEARIARMDLDSTQQKKRYLEIINDFEDHAIDILVGTQMVTKGLDFDNVSVVGIINADNLISFPDFRAYERAFQQIVQVSGRAGRHGERGTVVIQTYNPWHATLRQAIDNDYKSLFNSQIQERLVFKYPPHYKLIEIVLRHREQSIVQAAANQYAQWLRAEYANQVLGPEFPSVGRIRNQYLMKILVRFELGAPISRHKQRILQLADLLLKNPAYTRVTIQFDVDPQ